MINYRAQGAIHGVIVYLLPPEGFMYGVGFFVREVGFSVRTLFSLRLCPMVSATLSAFHHLIRRLLQQNPSSFCGAHYCCALPCLGKTVPDGR